MLFIDYLFIARLITMVDGFLPNLSVSTTDLISVLSPCIAMLLLNTTSIGSINNTS